MHYEIRVELSRKNIFQKSDWVVAEFFSDEELLAYIRNHLASWKCRFRRLILFKYENANIVSSYEYRYLLDNLLEDVKKDIGAD